MPPRKNKPTPPPEPPTVGERAVASFAAHEGHLVPMETPTGIAFIAPSFIQIVSQPMLYDGARPRGPGRRPKVDPSSPSASWCRWITTRDGQRLVIFDSAENLIKLGVGSSWPAGDRYATEDDNAATPPNQPLPYDEDDE